MAAKKACSTCNKNVHFFSYISWELILMMAFL